MQDRVERRTGGVFLVLRMNDGGCEKNNRQRAGQDLRHTAGILPAGILKGVTRHLAAIRSIGASPFDRPFVRYEPIVAEAGRTSPRIALPRAAE